MGDNFISSNSSFMSDTVKKILLIIVGILLFGGIFLFLILPSRLDKQARCIEFSENHLNGIEKCEENRFRQIVFVVGDTQNTPKPTLSKQYAEIVDLMYHNDKESNIATISVSEPDNNPKRLDIKSGKSVRKIKQAIDKQLDQMSAEKDGADYLEAIRTAASYVDNKDNTLIYVIGSGLSDKGLLNFAEHDLLNNDVDEIADSVATKIDSKGELDGITIFWDGMGHTIEPQEKLSTTLKTREEKIYAAVLNRLGLGSNNLVVAHELDEGIKNNEASGVVKPVQNAIVDLYFEFSDKDSASFMFIENTAQFKDLKAATEKATELAKQLNRYKSTKMSIKTYMSRGMCDGEKNDSLLAERSSATRDLLIKQGADGSRIEIEAGELGDIAECPNGLGHYAADPQIAAENRKVTLRISNK